VSFIKYDDGAEETLTAGDVLSAARHTAIVIADMKFLDFSPEKELNEVMSHIAKNGGAQRIKFHAILARCRSVLRKNCSQHGLYAIRAIE
jgi:hypothetical protein